MKRVKRTAVCAVLAAAILAAAPLKVYADSTVTGSGESGSDPHRKQQRQVRPRHDGRPVS